jgi:SAM-dependent methyltransferase
MPCPLCLSGLTTLYFADIKRQYRQCGRCRLVFVPVSQHLTPEQEKAEYDLHRNSPQDAGYRKFLSRVFLPLSTKLPGPAKGLDFGCGPGPTLSVMFTEAGYAMDVYDKFYADHRRVFDEQYDFVTCTEVVEHFSTPGDTFELLFSLLKPGGWLGIMTKLVTDQSAFAQWHYKNDLTHIAFFSRDTFRWLANNRQCHLEFSGTDVILLQKPLCWRDGGDAPQ